ncbi:unnamed protein product [Toxocara canis]|uniref:MFS domain-containing protein n=1 Tax=Toxocara canis TaxID=6265 RepID=A0A183U6X7_TOXCA|nr:unnamed protein product [Toxocara canis]
MHGVWRHWAPPMERSKLATTTFTGGYLGVMIGLPLSAYLVSFIDWSTPFYFYGVSGIIWTFFWFRISGSTPAKCRNISEDERRYIIEHVGHVSSSPATLTTIPWKSIFLSLPVWAIVICNFCRSWTFFLLLGNQLTYMADVLHLEIHNVLFCAFFSNFISSQRISLSHFRSQKKVHVLPEFFGKYL